ncbi:NAD-dependent epimerase/dehydratase family protein [bacterium]|nr:NAD-dependent epimerase/dehydratase family protein [bacterium]MBU1990840.1 NAD-dependent epimerase/dehydratase family protein [bacterium]
MNILLTGSSGFIGSYFIKKYAEKYNIRRFSFLEDDFHSLDCSGIDGVIHLSALVHQMDGASAKEYEKVNLNQTLELAKKAKVSGVKHFVFMSTVKVYGEETDIAYTENTQCKPQDAYGKSKLRAEKELLKMEDKNFKVSVIRTPIVYGYGVKANIKSLVNLVQKVSILPFGEIDNKRSMVYIGNLCHLVDEVIGQGKSGIFLAGDDEVCSTSRLIELISKHLDKKTTLVKIPLFKSLLKVLKPSYHKRLYGSLEVDNQLTRKRLDLKNPYSVDEGIQYMIYGEKS